MDNKSSFVVKGLAGKKTLRGEINIKGAKNAILKVLAAAILFKDEITVTNVPNIEDVNRSFEVLTELGAVVIKINTDTFKIITSGINRTDISVDISKRMRSSIVFTGPLLARFGQVSFPHPGGCVIGKRPIDLFLSCFAKMGTKASLSNDIYYLKTSDKKLKASNMFFRVQSVTATETMLMSAVLARGKTVLKNCALEPEIASLANYLNVCGAKIEGIGTPTLIIQGGALLSGKNKIYHTIPDRIDAGSFVILGALCGKDIKIKNCVPEHIEALTQMLQESGVNIQIGKDWVRVTDAGSKKILPFDIKTHEYPGFATDVQAPISILLTQTEGESFIFETIWENRLNYLETLSFMGAKVKILDSHRAIIYGKTPLRGREMASPDLRAGLAYLLAAIVAEGESIVHNAYYIDRGYEDIEGRLSKLGVQIERV
jgi:UDP-N-acetylglucosamine 1-carboxyvinyltransferase